MTDDTSDPRAVDPTKGDRPQSGWDGVPFTKMPVDLVADRDVSDAGLRLYAKLMEYVARGGDTAGAAWPGYERMSDELGWSMEKMVRTMKLLVHAGWVHRRRRPGTSSLTFVCSRKGQRPTWEGDPNKSDSGSSDDRGARESRDIGSSARSEIGSSNNRDSVSKEELENENQGTTPPSAEPTGGKDPRWSEAARGVATAVWERFKAQERTPNASSWRAVAQVAQRLLDVGHQPEVIVDAMMRVRACTVNALLVELGPRDTEGRPAPPPDPTASAPPRPANGCELCHEYPGWVESPVLADDGEPIQMPCPTCYPAAAEKWLATFAPPPADPDPGDSVQQRLPRRRDVD